MRAKQPKLVLREACVHDASRDWTPGSFLEMGAGTGLMTQVLLDRGFHGACYDLGDDSRRLARKRLASYGARMVVVDDVSALQPASFDYLFAFEVLEHIEDDLAALREWARYVRPGGKVLVSVPAHARKYGRSDELVGHVRRYEKQQLGSLLEQAGFSGVRVVNYGFPITEVTRVISNWLVRKDASYDTLSATERSIRSAQAKPRKIQKLLSLVSGNLVLPFVTVQRWFYSLDLGDGYVAVATRDAA